LPSYAEVDQSLAEGVRPSKAEWPTAGRPPGLEVVGREGLLSPEASRRAQGAEGNPILRRTFPK
jgi:hypothetical protein